MGRKINNFETFWNRVDKSGECWEWLGGKDRDGYGRIVINGKWWGSHRLSYTLVKGEIPKGLVICHSCDNPGCVNPSHLFVGTQTDNVKDMDSKGRRVNWRIKK